MGIQQWQIQPKMYFMHVKLISTSKKCGLWVYLFQMNILTHHQVMPKSTVLFKTQHNTTHRPLGQPVTPVLTSFLTLAKIQVTRFNVFSPSTLLEWRKERKNECWRAKNKKFFPRPCQTLYNCHELQVRVVCRGKNLSPSCHEYLCSVLSMPSRPAPSLTLVMRRTLVKCD